MSYSQKYLITANDMDMEYRMKNMAAITYFQDCVARYMTSKHVAAFDIVDKHLYWVISELNIEVQDALPFWSEEIEVRIWVSEISKLKIYIDFEIYYKNKIFMKGNSLWFIISSITKRPVSTDIIESIFDVNPKFALKEHKKIIFPTPKNPIVELSHHINLSDLDFNNHVNNRSYVNIATSTAPDDFYKKHQLKALTVRYLKETFLDDTLVCRGYKLSNFEYFHTLEKENERVCLVLSKWENKKEKGKIEEFPLLVREK